MNKIQEALQKVEEMKQRNKNKAQLMDKYVPATWTKCKDDDERKQRRREYGRRFRILHREEYNAKRREKYANDPKYRANLIQKQTAARKRRKAKEHGSTESI